MYKFGFNFSQLYFSFPRVYGAKWNCIGAKWIEQKKDRDIANYKF